MTATNGHPVGFRTLSLPQSSRLVLGTDLNCSELGHGKRIAELTKKKAQLVGWALIQALSRPGGDTWGCWRHRDAYHLISHVVLCGMSIAV